MVREFGIVLTSEKKSICDLFCFDSGIVVICRFTQMVKIARSFLLKSFPQNLSALKEYAMLGAYRIRIKVIRSILGRCGYC
jgi:hypothetical protein